MTFKPWQLVAILAIAVVLAAGTATGITLGGDGADRPFGGRFGMMHGDEGVPPFWGGHGPRMHGDLGDDRVGERMRGLLQCLDRQDQPHQP